MTLYQRKGLHYFPKNLWWVAVHIYPIGTLLALLLGMLVWFNFAAFVFAFWAVLVLSAFLYTSKTARPCVIQQLDSSLRITCTKYFSVYDTEIKTENLAVELFKDRYYSTAVSGSGSQYYVYIYDASDKKVRLEISNTFYVLGEILDKLSQSPQISLGDRELNFIDRYREKVESDKKPLNRFLNFSIPLALIGLAIFIAYKLWGK